MATIGGVTVGAAGTGIFAGFSLLTGDDFDTLPTRWNGGASPTGKYASSSPHAGQRHLTDRVYRHISLDPAWKGANSTSDTALGVEPLTVASSVATLTAAPLSGTLSAYLPTDYTPSLSTATLDSWPSVLVSAAGDFVIDATISFSAGVARGWWPAFWTSTLINWPHEGEIDVFESKKDASGNIVTLTTLHESVADGTPGTGDSMQSILTNHPITAGQAVRYVARKQGTTLTFFDDSVTPGTLAQTATYTGSLVGRIRGAHRIRFDMSVAESWDGSTFNIADWPQSMSISDWKLWVPTSRYAPFIAHTVLPAVTTTPGGSWASTFPDAVTLYGATPDIETITPAFDNPDVPGQVGKGYVDATLYAPGGMTVDRTGRTISGTVPLDKGGAVGMLFAGSFAAGGQARAALKMFNVAPAAQASLFSDNTAVNVGVTTVLTVARNDFHSGNLGPHTYTASSNKSWAVVAVAGDSKSFTITCNPSAIDSAVVTINATNAIGQVTTITRTVNTASVFKDSFTYADGNLETVGAAYWTRSSGAILGALKVSSGHIICTTADNTGSLYQSPSLGSADMSSTYVQGTLLGYAGFLVVLATDVNNHLGIRANSSTTKPEVYAVVNGTRTLVASFNETVAASDVIRMDYKFISATITVTKNGVPCTLASGSLGVVAGPPVSYRQGLIGRLNNTITLLDNYEAGLLPNIRATMPVTPAAYKTTSTATSDGIAATIAVTESAYTVAAPTGVRVSGTAAATQSPYTVAVVATDPETGGVAITLGSFTMDAEAGGGGSLAAVDVTLASFTVSAVAADPEASSIAVALGNYVAGASANSRAGATVAVILSAYQAAAVAADPDSSAIAAQLAPFVVAMAGQVAAAGVASASVALHPGPYTVNAVALDPEASAIAVTVGSYVAAAQADVGILGEAASFMDAYQVSIAAADPESTAVALMLDAYSVDVEAFTELQAAVADIDIVLQPFGVVITARNNTGPLTLSEILPLILNGLVNGRVWQDATPDDLPRDANDQFLPFIVWSRMGGMDSEYVEQFPPPSHSHARLQITSVAPGAIVADRLTRQVEEALLASTYTVGVLGSPVGTYDNARKLRGRRQLFSLWFRQSLN